MHEGVILHIVNLTEVKVVAERMNRHPEFLQETMFKEHGTRVLIKNPEADKYLDQAAKQKNLKDKYPQWHNEEPPGEPSY